MSRKQAVLQRLPLYSYVPVKYDQSRPRRRSRCFLDQLLCFHFSNFVRERVPRFSHFWHRTIYIYVSYSTLRSIYSGVYIYHGILRSTFEYDFVLHTWRIVKGVYVLQYTLYNSVVFAVLELFLQREGGLNRNTCIWYVEVWELKLYFYPSAGGFKKKKRKKSVCCTRIPWYYQVGTYARGKNCHAYWHGTKYVVHPPDCLSFWSTG